MKITRYTIVIFLHYGDITDTSSLINVIANINLMKFMLVCSISCSYITQVPEYTTYVNVMGSIKILESINFSPESKFYNAATSELYGKVLEPIQNENTNFNPQSPYAIKTL